MSDKTDNLKANVKQEQKVKKKIKMPGMLQPQILAKPPKKRKLKLIAKPINKININRPEEIGVQIGTLILK